MREAISNNKINQTALQRLRDEKAIVEDELRDLKVSYTQLDDNMRGVLLQLGSTKKEIHLTYNEIDALKQGIIKMRASKDIHRDVLHAAKEEAQSYYLNMLVYVGEIHIYNPFFIFLTMTILASQPRYMTLQIKLAINNLSTSIVLSVTFTL